MDRRTDGRTGQRTRMSSRRRRIRDTYEETLTKKHLRRDTYEETLTIRHLRRDTYEETLTKRHLRRNTYEETLTKRHLRRDTYEETLTKRHLRRDTYEDTLTITIPCAVDLHECRAQKIQNSKEVCILRDLSRQPACPPPQAPSSIYLHRDDPSTQALIPRTATQHKGNLGPGF